MPPLRHEQTKTVHQTPPEHTQHWYLWMENPFKVVFTDAQGDSTSFQWTALMPTNPGFFARSNYIKKGRGSQVDPVLSSLIAHSQLLICPSYYRYGPNQSIGSHSQLLICPLSIHYPGN